MNRSGKTQGMKADRIRVEKERNGGLPKEGK